MNAALWIVSGLLAAVYLAAGTAKLTQPYAKLAENPNMAWVNDFSAPLVRTIGALEVLGAIGLVVPWLTDVAHVLTPTAAVGLAALQAGALATHLRRREPKVVPLNLLLLLLAVFVAAGRFAGWGT